MAKRQLWRDVYRVHPSADAFPKMSSAELKELGEDIRRNTLKTKILLWDVLGQDGQNMELVLDGRNRLDAMELVGIPVLVNGKIDPEMSEVLSDMSSMSAGALAVALNCKRRHLTAMQKVEMSAAAFEADKMFRASLQQSLTVPTGEQSPVGTVRDRKGRVTKGSESPNRSIVGHVADATGVDRKTARKYLRDASAKEARASAEVDAEIMTMLTSGATREAIRLKLGVSPNRIANLRKQTGDGQPPSKLAATPTPLDSPSPPARSPRNHDKRIKGVLEELAEITASDVTDPKGVADELKRHADRFRQVSKVPTGEVAA